MAKRITTLEDINKEVAIAQELGDKAREGRAYNIVGSIYLKLGDYQKAIQYHSKDLSIAKET